MHPNRNYLINKRDVIFSDDTCSLDLLDLMECHLENIRRLGNVLVIDTFSNNGWTTPLKLQEQKKSHWKILNQ